MPGTKFANMPLPCSDNHAYIAQSSDVPSTPANSLFVANLPINLSNHQLAFALQQSFSPFGRLRLIRASRDARGRPFGFVDYEEEESGRAALAAAVGGSIEIGGRVGRVERARFQGRLIIQPKYARAHEDNGDSNCSSTFSRKGVRFVSNSEHCSVLQFDDRETAIQIYNELKTDPGYEMAWMYPGTHQNPLWPERVIVRNSGLVQLFPNTASTNVNANVGASSNGKCNGNDACSSVSQHHLYTFEEEIFNGANTYAITTNSIYIGRLCSWRVTRDLLKERFSQYASIAFIRLFNRGVYRPERPMDAFAHIGFDGDEGREVAISREDGQCWLGQVITVQVLNTSRAWKLQAAARSLVF